MLTHDSTYLIRCWKRDQETCRVEVVHVQTGDRVLLDSTSAALAWIDGRPAVSVSGAVASDHPEVIGEIREGLS